MEKKLIILVRWCYLAHINSWIFPLCGFGQMTDVIFSVPNGRVGRGVQDSPPNRTLYSIRNKLGR